MHKEKDFTELIERVGSKVARDSRIGKGFNVWADPTDSNVTAVARHATGLVEDFGYKFFKERSWQSNEIGNRKLFALICKIRGKFSDSLSQILSNSVGYNVDRDREKINQTLLFNGCYFGATGAGSDEHAFVKSAMIKMMEQEEELSWTSDAIREDTRAMMLANVFGLLGIICSIGIVWAICAKNNLLEDTFLAKTNIFKESDEGSPKKATTTKTKEDPANNDSEKKQSNE